MCPLLKRLTIDLNSDIGELTSGNNDEQILRLVSSVNISCGVHAGSEELISRTIALAKTAGVAIGAHPGLAGEFGRGEGPIDPIEAHMELIRQLDSFRKASEVAGITVSHVKPHGSLYNQAETNADLADAIVDAINMSVPDAAVYGLAGGQLLSVARGAGLRTVGEFFADRAYEANGKLVPRSKNGAVYADSEEVVQRALAALANGTIEAWDGTQVAVKFDTVCVHGDSPAAVDMIKLLCSSLQGASVQIEPPQ
jgi:UPF0271 protein